VPIFRSMIVGGDATSIWFLIGMREKHDSQVRTISRSPWNQWQSTMISSYSALPLLLPVKQMWCDILFQEMKRNGKTKSSKTWWNSHFSKVGPLFSQNICSYGHRPPEFAKSVHVVNDTRSEIWLRFDDKEQLEGEKEQEKTENGRNRAGQKRTVGQKHCSWKILQNL
jgi:hypothetical protein